MTNILSFSTASRRSMRRAPIAAPLQERESLSWVDLARDFGDTPAFLAALGLADTQAAGAERGGHRPFAGGSILRAV